jgi:hypothetical protein
LIVIPSQAVLWLSHVQEVVMRKELRAATALVALLAWPALAQDTTSATPAGP